MRGKLFALIDCNNFFASCERVFRPDLRNKPIAVLSSNDGCIIARSDETKAFGVKMGIPLFECQDIVDRHNITLFSSNFSLYQSFSNRVFSILRDFNFQTEIYSIDEAFIDISNVDKPEVEKLALSIKNRIENSTGIPVSIGIASTKTLAKAAINYAKHHGGILNIDKLAEEQINTFLSQMDIGNVWGIGYRSTIMLKSRGFQTAYALKITDIRYIRKLMGIVGERKVLELNGISCEAIGQSVQKKGIIYSKSFGKCTTTYEELKEAVVMYATRASEKLRHQHSVTSYINVYIKSHKSENYSNGYEIKFPIPTSYTPEIISSAVKCLDKIYKDQYRYKKAGIAFGNVVPDKYRAIDLFEENTEEKNKRKDNFSKALDKINKKWGESTLFFAGEGIKHNWITKQTIRSPRYTKDWNDLLLVS